MTPLQRQRWLAARRKGLGGSVAAAAVGRSRWVTRLMLWEDKLGMRESAETPAMHWGTLKEPIIRQEFANITGRTVEVPRQMIWHPSIAWLFVNVDGISDRCRMFEAKAASTDKGWGTPGTDEVPEEYLLQAQHGMFVTGLPVTDLAVLIGHSDFRLYEIPADRELQELLVDQEAEFWQSVVTRKIPPPQNDEDVRRRWRVGNGQSIEADVEAFSAAEELSRIVAWIDVLKELSESKKAALQRFMTENSELTAAGGQVLATWKNTAPGRKFDLDTFQGEHPDLYARYLRDGTPQRRFLLKLKASLECPQQLPALALPATTTKEPATATAITAEVSRSGRKPSRSAGSPSNSASRRKSKVA
jgi:putative phage-type endonuclease